MSTNKRGFTLVELIIVLVIIGIGFMSVAPLIVEKTTGAPPELEYFDDLLKRTAKEAANLGRPLALTGIKGSATIILHDGTREEISGNPTVSLPEVNEDEQPGLEYIINVYPKGLCDYFTLRLSDGRIIEAVPLMLSTRFK
jgi:prepilin-type N-terminal cleavage/methylation domain-containing protein